MRRFTSCALVVATIILTTALFATADEPQKKAAVGQPAPNFSLQDQSGKTMTLADNVGKVVVLEWFNEDCPIDMRVYKQDDSMGKLAHKWMDKGVVWLAINSTKNKTNDTNKKAAEKLGINWPILNDAPGDVGHLYGATNTPHMYVIDQTGKLVYMGAIDDDPQGEKSTKINYVDKALGELMAGSSVSTPQTKAYGCAVKYAK
jgi:peroxiredoxin